jgi:hypothetical protein
MRIGSLCHIKSKKNALQTFVVVYPDIDFVLEQRNKKNSWLPCILTSSLCKPPQSSSKLKSTNESFVLLNKMQDEHGSFYYQCLYSDMFGWIIGSKKLFDIIEEDNQRLCQV